jgi:hypothetical protein
MPPDISDQELADLKAKASKVDDLSKEIETLKSKPAPKAEDETDLTDKVAKEKKEKEQKSSDTKKLETALIFTLNSDKFIKEHESILPKDMADIFEVASKEKYDSPIEKASAIKSALISSFFKVQANLDSLTASHKQAIEDFEKLTKRGREEKASEIYSNIFEPALGMIKQIKKAEELVRAKSGYADPSEIDAAYKEKLIRGSRAHYLGEKNG